MGQKRITIYDKNYYICKSLLSNKRFLDEVSKLLDYFKSTGVPIKKGGFSYHYQFKQWNKRFTEKAQEIKLRNGWRGLFKDILLKFIPHPDLDEGYYQFMFR